MFETTNQLCERGLILYPIHKWGCNRKILVLNEGFQLPYAFTRGHHCITIAWLRKSIKNSQVFSVFSIYPQDLMSLPCPTHYPRKNATLGQDPAGLRGHASGILPHGILRTISPSWRLATWCSSAGGRKTSGTKWWSWHPGVSHKYSWLGCWLITKCFVIPNGYGLWYYL